MTEKIEEISPNQRATTERNQETRIQTTTEITKARSRVTTNTPALAKS
jgi:hypothetical protein